VTGYSAVPAEAPVIPPPAPEPQAVPPLPVEVPSGVGQVEMTVLLRIIDRLLAQSPAAAAAPRPPSMSTNGGPMTPDQAAQVLLPYLTETALQQITQVAQQEAHGSLAAVFVGLANHYADQGNLSEFTRNGDWRQALSSPQPQSYGQPATFLQQPVAAYVPICEHCKHTFKPNPQNLRQRFCCSACGNIAAGYENEPLPHREGCTTAPGIELHRVLAAAHKTTAAQTLQ
jgi:hypothetical protein